MESATGVYITNPVQIRDTPGTPPSVVSSASTRAVLGGTPRQTSSAALVRKSSREALLHNRHKHYRQMCKRLGVIPRSNFQQQLGHYEINITNQNLDQREFRAICTVLVEEPEVRKLDVSGNVISEKVMSYVSTLAQHAPLKELRLCECDLSSDALYELLDLVEKQKTLDTLHLAGNQLSDREGIVLTEILQNGVGLRHVNLSHNNLRERGAMQLGDCLRNLQYLKNLNLSWNHIRGKGAECVAIGLMHNSSLSVLDISWNGFGTEGCVALGHALRCNSTLEELDVSCNRISPTGLLHLLQALKDNKSLRILRVCRNPIPAIVTCSLLCVLRDTKDLQLNVLDLSGTVVDHEFEKVLKGMQTKRPQFQVLYERAMPIYKPGGHLPPITTNRLDAKTPPPQVFNVDPVSILYYTKKDLRALDLFNRIDKDSSGRLSREEIGDLLKREGLPLSSQALDKLMLYLDTNGDGEIDFGEFMDGWRRYKREVLGQRDELLDSERLQVEVGDGEVRGDGGGLGGRFSQTYRGPMKKDGRRYSLSLMSEGRRSSASQLSDSRQSGTQLPEIGNGSLVSQRSKDSTE